MYTYDNLVAEIGDWMLENNNLWALEKDGSVILFQPESSPLFVRRAVELYNQSRMTVIK